MANSELFGNFLRGIGSGLSSSGFLSVPIEPSLPSEPSLFPSIGQPSSSSPQKTPIDVVEDYFKTPAGQGLSEEAKAKARETALNSTLTAFGANNEKEDMRRTFADVLKWHGQSINDARKYQAQSYLDQIPWAREKAARDTDRIAIQAFAGRPIMTAPLVSFNPEQRSWGPGGPRVV